MSCYQHLTTQERESILFLLGQKQSVRQIAASLHRSPSTISRELRRNKDRSALLQYSPSPADRQYHRRRKHCCRRRRLQEPQTYETVVSLLSQFWSPEQISGRLRAEENAVQISASTIYRGFYKRLFPRSYRVFLRARPYHKPGKHKRTGQIRIARTISERPEEANARLAVGHWESDTVRGTKGTGLLATHTDRKSRYEVAILLRDATSPAFMTATVEAMKGLPVKTFTADRGKEFARHELLTEQLNAEVYFADPHAPGQRGTNENTNGLLRQFFPKRRSFAQLTQEQVGRAVDLLNHRPRKCLGWQCPAEVFFGKVLRLT